MITRDDVLLEDISPIDYYFQFFSPDAKTTFDSYLKKRGDGEIKSVCDQLLRDFFIFKGKSYLTVFNLLSKHIDVDSFLRDYHIKEVNDYHKFMFILSASYKFYFPELESMLDTPNPPRNS